MGRFKRLTMGLVVSLGLLGCATTAVAAEQLNPQTSGSSGAVAAAPVCLRQSAANAAGYDIFLSTPNPVTYLNAGGAWQNVQCTETTFSLKAGQRALIEASFNAEADCNGTAPTNGQWCQTRALLNGTEMMPIAAEPDSFAFDSVAGGAQNWQAHSMARAKEVSCVLTDGCHYRFVVQTRMHDATVTSMWLDEIATALRVTIGAPAPF